MILYAALDIQHCNIAEPTDWDLLANSDAG